MLDRKQWPKCVALAASVGLLALSGCQLGFDPKSLHVVGQDQRNDQNASYSSGSPDSGTWDDPKEAQQKPIPKPTPKPIPKPIPKPVPKPIPVPTKKPVKPVKSGDDGYGSLGLGGSGPMPAYESHQGGWPGDPDPGSPSGGNGPGGYSGGPSDDGGAGSPAVAAGDCHTDSEGHLCLGMRYVVYRDANGQPLESEQDVANNLEAINQIWQRCGIAFQVDELGAVSPDEYGLRYRTADYDELDQIRGALGSDSEMLLVITGKWDRNGSLGSTWANAWTNMPGDGLYGAILERPVARDPNIMAHELGHYLSLDHASDATDVMSPVVYSNSTQLTRAQCEAARQAVESDWQKMLR